MVNPTKFNPKDDKSYPISWFREPFSLLVAMLYMLYELDNCIVFKVEWALAHHVLTIGQSFNCAKILSVVFEDIEKYQKNSTSRKHDFYPSGYVVDIFYVTYPFSAM